MTKVAGQSIRKALLKHCKAKGKNPEELGLYLNTTPKKTYAECRKEYRSQQALYLQKNFANWTDKFKFTFVRNPFDRAVSSWKYGGSFYDWNCSFEEFAQRIDKKNLRTPTEWTDLTWHTYEQAAHLTDNDGKVLVDYVGRFESIEKDFEYVCTTLGFGKLHLPHVNKTKRTNYLDYYNSETKSIIAKKFERDLDVFKYTF